MCAKTYRTQAVYILYGAFILAAVKYGMGKHNKSLSQDDEIQALKVNYTESIVPM
jgi:hypothetical protein